MQALRLQCLFIQSPFVDAMANVRPQVGWHIGAWEYYNVANKYRAVILLAEGRVLRYQVRLSRFEECSSVSYVAFEHDGVPVHDSSLSPADWHGGFHDPMVLRPGAIRVHFDYSGSVRRMKHHQKSTTMWPILSASRLREFGYTHEAFDYVNRGVILRPLTTYVVTSQMVQTPDWSHCIYRALLAEMKPLANEVTEVAIAHFETMRNSTVLCDPHFGEQ